MSLGLAGIVNAWGALDVLAFALLGYAIHQQPYGRALARTLVWAAVGYGLGLSWMRVFGITPWLILSLWHVLFVLPLAMCAAWLLRHNRLVAASVALAGLFALGEWLRGQGALGVSMHTAAGALARNPVAVQWASVFGAFGLSFCVAAIGLLIGLSLRARRNGAVVLAVLAGAGLLLGSLVISRLEPCPADPIRVAAIQGVAADGFQDPLPDADAEEIYLRLTALAAREHRARLIVWPETSCPGDPATDDSLRQRLATAFRRLEVAALVGARVRQPGGDGLGVQRNVVLGFGSDGFLTGAYEKMRLVPFGEYVPFLERRPHILGRWGVSQHPYAPGRDWPVIPFGDLKVGVLVCSESMFAELAIRRVQQGAQLLVIVSNDSYFGRTSGAEQIARQAILRAVETRRAVVRAAETGRSMIIDPYGRSVRQSKLYRRAALSGFVVAMRSESFYTRTAGRWPWIVAAVTALAFVCAIASGRQGSRDARDVIPNP